MNPTHSTSLEMRASPSALCTTCAAIDFKALLYTLEDANAIDPVIPLGDVEDLIQRVQVCELCRLIVDALRERHSRASSGLQPGLYCGFEVFNTRETPSKWLEDFVAGRLPSPWNTDEMEKYGFPVRWAGHPIACSITTTFFCSQRRQLDESGEGGSKKQSQSFRLSRLLVTLSSSPWIQFSIRDAITLQVHWDSDDIEILGQNVSRVGSGRELGPLLQLSRVREWLRQCEEQHGDECACPAWIREGEGEALTPKALRIIDVKERRIVDSPLQSRYLALSYVWGGDQQSLDSRLEWSLTTQNLEKLQQVNGLDNVALSNTIQDAITFTLDLGERYLWVDALCILQDDVGDLAAQTSQMDLVYSGAVLTILAASGDDSHCGLAGTVQWPRNVFSRRVQVSSEGLYLAPTAALSSDGLLPKSTWNSRGWTFQERLLSRRSVVFTKAQVFWLCECSMWDEETILEPTEPQVWVLPQALGCNDEWDDNFPRFSRESMSVYIAQYSSRNFTFPADAHSAFLGILRRYEHLNKAKTMWALPVHRFDQYLTWQGGMERRKELHRLILDNSATCLVPFPSWSWLGWSGFIGGVIYNSALAERTRAGDAKSDVKFYSLKSDGTVQMVDTSETESEGAELARDASDVYSAAWKGNTTITGCIADYHGDLLSRNPHSVFTMDQFITSADLPVHDTGRLLFWTSHVEAMAWVNQREREVLCLDTRDGVLEVSANFPYEELYSHLEGRHQPVTINETNSESTGDEATYGEADVLDASDDKKESLNFIVVSRVYQIGKSDETGKLNIMIIKESPTEPGVWSRMGHAMMEEKDWLRLDRRWKVVILA